MISERVNLRPVDGILLINKPQGLSSNAALQRVKKIFNAKKAGHTGSLDPLATGMLPVCFGQATKVSQYLLSANKTYQVTGLLGIKTNTGDALGEIIAEKNDFEITQQQLLTILHQFIGTTKQMPSMYSALKHQGQPLYKLARLGLTVERKLREITIDDINLIAFDGRFFSANVSCSKGTYIRNLVEDIGEKLGVYAHVTQLHRMHTAHFVTNKMYTIDELAAKDYLSRLECLLPFEQAIDYLPVVILNAQDTLYLRQGKIITFDASYDQKTVRVHDNHANFIGIAVLQAGQLIAKRLMAYK